MPNNEVAQCYFENSKTCLCSFNLQVSIELQNICLEAT